MSGENAVHEWKTILLTTVVISRTFCMHGEQKKELNAEEVAVIM